MVYIFLSAAEITSWSQNYALMGLIVFLLLLSILLVRTNGHPEELLETESTGNRHIRDIHRT